MGEGVFNETPVLGGGRVVDRVLALHGSLEYGQASGRP